MCVEIRYTPNYKGNYNTTAACALVTELDIPLIIRGITTYGFLQGRSQTLDIPLIIRGITTLCLSAHRTD